MKRFIVGITGASGAIYGVRLVEALAADPEREVHLIVSRLGARVIEQELGRRVQLEPFAPESFLEVDEPSARRIIAHPVDDLMAGPASGTFRVEAMVICPCSMRTVGAVAAGLGDNLLTRAADVALKEGRPLVLVPRETPWSLIHLENLTKLARAGTLILPASPGFYHRPQTIDDLVDFMVQKIFDRLGLRYPGGVRWGGEPPE